ncbi:endolysin [Bacillus phage pW4]|uniref:Endolysin n=1 Tax=Bacillus phage pW4 TaxID=2500560 RepID=A0A3Q9R7T7_9CAUD|nr:endolysin [Bacillus phage pW4]AZU99073.1 endolysin [Bacillus phage pW4]
MAKVSSHGGHNEKVQGANWGDRKEHVMDRQCNTDFINKLRALGHDVKNDTDDLGTTASMIVNNQVRNINSRYNDVGFAWHLNASDTTGHGVEVLCYSEKELPMANKISAEIAKRTGWRDRGGKIRNDLGVIRSTACPVFLIEAGFIDNDSDMAKWNVDKITSAVIFAYFGQETSGGSNNNGGGQPVYQLVRTYGIGFNLLQEVANQINGIGYECKIVVSGKGDGLFEVETSRVPNGDLDRLTAWFDSKGWKYYYVK